MPTINYIIATYSGIQPNRRASENPEFVLQKHLEELCAIFLYKAEQKIENLVKHVIIVCPKPRGSFYPKYYEKEKWLKSESME